MSLGLTDKELNDTFQKGYKQLYDSMKGRQDKDIAKMVATGMSEIEATRQVLSTMQLMSSSNALLFVINANNLRIQSQLAQKGIEI